MNSNPNHLVIIDIGKIIGRGGEVITMIQQRSGAKVQIDQNVPEGEFNMHVTHNNMISQLSI